MAHRIDVGVGNRKSIVSNAATLLLLLLLGLSLPACGLSGGPIDGAVLEEGTNSPIPGAIVVVRWQHHQGHSGTVCYHVESAVTDETGRFHIPRWSDPSDHRTLTNPQTSPVAYKSGFEWVRSTNNIFYVKRFTGTTQERLEILSRSAVACTDKRDIEIKLLLLYRALYEEAQSIAHTPDERREALLHLKDIEVLELGSDKAWDNFHERERDLK
jgi:hypothetical protein